MLQGAFSFPNCDWLCFFQSWCIKLYKNLEHWFQQPVAKKTCNTLLICECFLQGSCGYLLPKFTILKGKKIPCISQGMKKNSLLIDLSKLNFLKIMCHYAFLLELIWGELCNFAPPHNSGSRVSYRKNKSTACRICCTKELSQFFQIRPNQLVYFIDLPVPKKRASINLAHMYYKD